MSVVIRYNVAEDTRTWFDKLCGVPVPQTFVGPWGSEVLDVLVPVNRANEQFRRCRIRKVHIPRKPAEDAA